MSMTDPIADMLTRIRNGIQAGHRSVEIPGSGMKKKIAGVLHSQGFIKSYQLRPGNMGRDNIVVEFDENVHEILIGLRRISKPGRRVYINKENLPNVLNGMGIAIISTSKGLMTGEEARQAGMGGEFVCEIW